MIKNSSVTCTEIIPKPYKEMCELPELAYTKSEWDKIENETMGIVDGVRMVYDYQAWERLKYKNQNDGMNRLGLI